MLKGRKNNNINFDSNTFYFPVYSLFITDFNLKRLGYLKDSNAAEDAVDSTLL